MLKLGSSLRLPRFKAAAVQTAPVYLDAMATAKKSASLIREAAHHGASIVAFPEVFIPGYPYWNWLTDPLRGSEWFERLARAAILVPGPEIDVVRRAARRAGLHVVIGVNERSPISLGTIYNTMVFIGPDGTLLGRHRKLVPTWAEKLTWSGGDGSSLKVYQTEIGPLGGLACGENTNTLARFALLAQGELVHVASYIALPVAPPDYDMAEAIKLRAMAHSFEGKLFTIVSCSTISAQIVSAMQAVVPDAGERLERKSAAFSGIIGPDGRIVGAPLIDEEGIVYADVDLGKCVAPKQMHDIVGHYNRFDVFKFAVNTAPCAVLNAWEEPAPPVEPKRARANSARANRKTR
jgi:aliphatic nitrilase